jgi:hypothetical protein
VGTAAVIGAIVMARSAESWPDRALIVSILATIRLASVLRSSSLRPS